VVQLYLPNLGLRGDASLLGVARSSVVFSVQCTMWCFGVGVASVAVVTLRFHVVARCR
jgi:hypothetical protein